MDTRRNFIRKTGLAAAGIAASNHLVYSNIWDKKFESMRPPVGERLFTSQAIEDEGTKVPIHLVILAEDGIYVLRAASQALHVGPTSAGDNDRSEGKGQIGQQRAQQDYPQKGDDDLPAEILAQASHLFSTLRPLGF